jgi:hypothetical protein
LETRRTASNTAIESLNINGRINNNQQLFSVTFNSYFLSTAGNMNVSKKALTHKTNIIPVLTIIIVPYNMWHRLTGQQTQKLRKNPQQLLKLKKN